MYGQTDRPTDTTKPTAVSRQFMNAHKMICTSHTDTQIPLSDMTADQAFRHVLPSDC